MKHCFSARPAMIVFLLLSVLISTGCKENVFINSKVSPANTTIGIFSTELNCITRTYYDDTSLTSVNFPGIPIYQGVGSVTDPFFGTMTGATYFQVVPADATAELYASDSIDSAFLILPYSGFTFGDTSDHNATQTYQVFYVQDALSWDSVYYSFTTKSIDATFPLSEPATVKIHDLIDSFGTAVLAKNYPGLRIKLKLSTLLGRLLPAHAALVGTTSPFKDFQNAFKGICVRVADTRKSGSVYPYFQLDGATIYSEASIHVYHHPNGDPYDTLIQPYYFDPEICSHFNSITKSYSRYPVNKLYTSTQANDEIVALQNLPGASIDLVVPGISTLPVGVINKAELRLTLLPGTYNPAAFPAPQKLYPQAIASNTYPDATTGYGNGYLLADYFPTSSLSPLNILDGYMHTFIRNGTAYNTYTINIPREVMASIRAKNDTIHLHINGTQDYYGAFHMVAGGGNYADPLYRPKLFVVYSKLSN